MTRKALPEGTTRGKGTKKDKGKGAQERGELTNYK